MHGALKGTPTRPTKKLKEKNREISFSDQNQHKILAATQTDTY